MEQTGTKRRRWTEELSVVPASVPPGVSAVEKEPPAKKRKTDGGTERVSCTVCALDFNSKYQLDAHKMGKKHSRKAAEAGGAKRVTDRKEVQAALLNRLGSQSLAERKRELKVELSRAQVGSLGMASRSGRPRKKEDDGELSDPEDYNLYRKQAKKAFREMGRKEKQKLKKRLKRRRAKERQASGGDDASLASRLPVTPSSAKKAAAPVTEKTAGKVAEALVLPTAELRSTLQVPIAKAKQTRKPKADVKVVTSWDDVFSTCTIIKRCPGSKTSSFFISEDKGMALGSLVCAKCKSPALEHSLRIQSRKKFSAAVLPKLAFSAVIKSKLPEEDQAALASLLAAQLHLFHLLADLRIILIASERGTYAWAMAVLEQAYHSSADVQALGGQIGQASLATVVKATMAAVSQELSAAFLMMGSLEEETKSTKEWLQCLCHVDEAYFQLFYHWRCHVPAIVRRSTWVTHYSSFAPLAWFGRTVAARDWMTGASAKERRGSFFQTHLQCSEEDVGALERQLWTGEAELVQLYLLNLDDTLAIFGGDNDIDVAAEMADTSKKLQRKPCGAAEALNSERASREPPCFTMLEQWRESAKSWLCRLYAFAVPNRRALEAITGLVDTIAKADVSPEWVEIGAGTGYWCHLVQEALEAAGSSAKVAAYDIRPCPMTATSALAQVSKNSARSSEDSSRNDYHGQCLAYLPVGQGGPDALLSHVSENSEATILFLCYPPPNSPMAEQCLDRLMQHKGRAVVVVGEWQGDTATGKFERNLVRRFHLKQAVPLPNWMDTANCLTIWTSDDTPEPTVEELKTRSLTDVLTCAATYPKTACSACGQAASCRRCVYCAKVLYCSPTCMEEHREAHTLLHRLHFLEPLSGAQHLCGEWETGEWKQLRMLQ